MGWVEPLVPDYIVTRVNPVFNDESLKPTAETPISSLAFTRVSEQAGGNVSDSVRQLSEGLSQSPTVLAVCRALETKTSAASEVVLTSRRVTDGMYLWYSQPWNEYLGSGIVPGDITLRAKGYEQVVDLTLDSEGADRLLALVEHGTRQRCCCRIFTAVLAISFFMATIVAVSLVVSRGQRVFGAL